MEPLFADSAAPTLALGDFLIILSMVVGSAVFVIWRLATVDTRIEKTRRRHEEHCANYSPAKPGATNPRGVRALDTLEDL